MSLRSSLGAQPFHRADGDVGQVRAAEIHRHLSRLDLGQQQQVPDEAQEARGVPFDHLEAMAGVRAGHAVLPEDLDEAEDRRQRCPELVRDQADESSFSRSSSRSFSFLAISWRACSASVFSALVCAVTSREMPKVPMIRLRASRSGIFVVSTQVSVRPPVASPAPPCPGLTPPC